MVRAFSHSQCRKPALDVGTYSANPGRIYHKARYS